MTILSTIASAIRAIGRDQRGSFAYLFAFTAIPILMVFGMVFDFGYGHVVRGRLQHAMDAAALAAGAARAESNADRIALAEKIFAANYPAADAFNPPAAIEVKIAGDKVHVTASASVPTGIWKMFGVASVPVASLAEVDIPVDRKAEIVLVLDYSGSMTEVSGGKVKYVAMRDAAAGLIENVGLGGKNSKVKFALVPFSHHVYLSLPGEYVLGGTAGTTWTGCTQDRKHPYNIDDATPIPGNSDTLWGQPQAKDHKNDGCDGHNHDGNGYAAKNLVVMPLTDDHQAVSDQLAAMDPYAWTNISLGLEFGWHVISPNAPFAGAAAYGDKETLKVIVLLTDGRQTEPAFGPGTVRSVAQGEKNLEALCEAVKSRGVRIVTVAFDLDDAPTESRLRTCASSSKEFFIAEDSADVASAFEAITGQLQQAIYLSK